MKIHFKKILSLLAIAGFLFFVTACQKDAQKSIKDKLEEGDWSIISSKVAPGFFNGTDTITDLYAIMDDCEKDNILRFFENNIVSIDEGATKCDSLDPQGINGTWAFIEDNTKIVYDADTFNLIEVTSDKLTFSFSNYDDSTTVRTVTNIYNNIK
ncbi:hypothetical protein BH11BAC2_BH11BAC2_12770 [soil metagenome]